MEATTIINSKDHKEQPVPEIGKEYHVFDDGKIKPSRHSIVKVMELIPFKECKDTALMSVWTEDVEEYPWLYAKETDYFVKVEYVNEPRLSHFVKYFTRTTDGNWFSLGFFGSQLDIDGSLYNKMLEGFEEE